MVFPSIILAAAKSAKVSGSLLIAICTHESGLTNVMVHNDGGSPTYGVCQVKEGTARLFGYKGNGMGLMDPKTNAKYAALYLKYQINRYGDDWVKIVSAYNAGSYTESKKKPGCPRNLKYVKLVQKKLEKELQPRLTCGKM